MTNLKLLLVDRNCRDDKSLACFLERSGFTVIHRRTTTEALNSIIKLKPDVIVTDIVDNIIDGRKLLRSLRTSNISTPIIFFTDIGDSVERAITLNEGADDYITKQIHPSELLARINRTLFRAVRHSSQTLCALRAGEIRLDLTKRQVFLGKRELAITPKALNVLEYLMKHPQQLVSRQEMLNNVWGWNETLTTRAVDLRIYELRNSLDCNPREPRFIRTVFGAGYQFIVPVTRE